MKTMNVQFTVIAASVLMACLLSTGCASVNKATKLPKMNNQIVMVIPVQGPPVVVDNVPLGVGVMGGMIGVGLQRTATADARRELATRLNRDAGDFRPEVILAEECAQLLRDSPIHSVQVM